MTKDKKLKDKIDLIIKIVLIVIIILLLIHNCVLIKDKKKYQNAPVPNGNVDVIEIDCNSGKCTNTPTPTSKPSGKDNKNNEIKSIGFTQNNVSVKKGNTLKLIPIVKPSSKASSRFTWKSSDLSIVSVDANGNIKGLKEGTATITVTSSNGRTAKCIVTVTKETVNVNKIVLNPTEMNLKVGNIEQISASIEPENATERDIVWSTSDKTIATVDENGVIKALKSGTITITAKTKDGKVKATVSVNVESIEVKSITLNPTEMSVKVGTSSQITAIVEPENAMDKELIWETSDASVVTVDSTGKVTGVKTGTAVVTAKTKDGKIKSICTVNITTDTIDVEKIILSPTSVTVKEGLTSQITATVMPENATNRELVWTTSDASVAIVDNTGKVTGVKKGTATITVKTKDGKVKATVTVNVEANEVEKITLSSDKLSLKVGSTSKITATVTPENATDKELVWTTSDASIATVDSTGKVTGVKKGTVTITAKTKDGKVKATCTVNVEAIEVKSITLNPTEMSVKVGTSSQITATVTPENATDKELIWETSNASVATVDSTGKVTGVKTGTAVVTAKTKDGKIKSICTVNITTDTIDVEKIILSPTSVTVKEGLTSQITATVMPENATNRELVWTTSDASVATVDNTGKVTGVKKGTVTITAKTKDGKVKATITVTVEEIPNEVVVYDEDKDPVTWNGSNDLNIFSKSIYNVDGFIAPESENTYKFVVKNNTIYKVKYNVTFIETNEFNINMKYKLKKNDGYLINTYSSPSALNISDFELNPGESDTYYLDWKWLSSSNDTSIGNNPEAKYGLKIEVEAESING